MIKRLYKEFVSKLPYARELKLQLTKWNSMMAFPPGHFYSPVVDPDSPEIRKLKHRTNEIENYAGVELNEKRQKKLVEEFSKYYSEIPFPERKSSRFRYFFENNFYTYSDAIFLYALMRYARPSKVVEIGSGYSSALMLDVNDLYFESNLKISFIEPYPDRLLELISKEEAQNLIKKNIQDVDISVFKELRENDILFVDSSHVVKSGHDVNYILFEILPSLNPGVYIHFHDIFSSFEYPIDWITEHNLNWNEIYFLKAFLMYNSAFEIVLFNSFLQQKYQDWFRENMPLCLKTSSTVCGSLWLRKK